mgnify:CR=1 FL=1
MSIVYTIKEHISSTFDKTPSIRLGIVNTLISIGSEMLLGRAHVLELSLTSNGKTYTFSGKEINHTKDAISLDSDMKNIHFYLNHLKVNATICSQVACETYMLEYQRFTTFVKYSLLRFVNIF